MTDSPKRCFVIAPIGDEGTPTRKRSDTVLKHIIAPVVESRGYTAMRADRLAQPGLITGQVLQRIVDDELVIADLTNSNPNVFYELALRHALRKPLVQIIAKNERIPFDVAGMRTVQLDESDLDSVAAAKEEIGRQIDSMERDPGSMETPISFSLDIHSLRETGDPEGRSLAELAEAVSELRAEMRSGADTARRLKNAEIRLAESDAELRGVTPVAEFIWSRASWLDVQAIPNENDRYSVALRLDGFYSDRDFAEDMADDYRSELQNALATFRESDLRRLKDWGRVDKWWKE
jgi:hypothetical protein